MGAIKLAIFDVAGTTAKDDGLVVGAFQKAMVDSGFNQYEIEKMTEYVSATMGQRKIDVFTHLCRGDLEEANRIHERFVEAYNGLVFSGALEEFPGISNFFRELRERGVGVGITTGFPRIILDPILEKLQWAELVDVSVAASEVKEGRPAPDMIFKCLHEFASRVGGEILPQEMAVVGDTPSDIQSGHRAHAGLVLGVTSGAFTRMSLEVHKPSKIFNFATEALSDLIS